MTRAPLPGEVVAYWDGNDLAVAVAAGEEKRRIRIVRTDGRDERIPAGRIVSTLEPAGPVPGRDPESLRAAGARATEQAGRLEALAATVDVGTVWELTVETGGTVSPDDLADLAFGRKDENAKTAVIMALLRDGLHFGRKTGGWEPRTAGAVDEIRSQRRREAEREAERDDVRRALAGAGRGEDGAGSFPDGPFARRTLAALEALALHDLDCPDDERGLALEALEASAVRFDRPHEGAFRLLRRLGRFVSDDENLAIHRYRIRTEFPEETSTAARAAALRRPDRSGRADLTGLPVLTIDGATTREIDDGLSLEPSVRGAWRVGVHIADPAAFIEAGDAVDAEAERRGISHYLPDRRIPMLPPEIGEAAASLAAGQDRPAISFFAEIGSDGMIEGWEVVRSIVRTAARLTYAEAERLLETEAEGAGRTLRGLLDVAEVLEASRLAAGAVRIRVPEVDVRVGEDGAIRLDRIDPTDRARRIVSEAMILASSLAARFCGEREVPAIYRRQSGAEGELPAVPVGDLVAARAARRLMRRGEVGLEAGPHRALGVEAYAQATSPLRRFQDLANHRQIAGTLAGRDPAYDAEALRRIAALTDRAEIEARRAERASERYWLLRHLEAGTGGEVLGVVADVEPRPVVVLHETLLELPVPALAGGVAVGEQVRLVVERVNPRADLVALRPRAGETGR